MFLILHSLHSTMFLLIPENPDEHVDVVSSFTFHNVSINTGYHSNLPDADLTLHSTMFLLIRITYIVSPRKVYALHSTRFLLIHSAVRHRTRRNRTLHSTMFLLIQRLNKLRKKGKHLYIPQCFY